MLFDPTIAVNGIRLLIVLAIGSTIILIVPTVVSRFCPRISAATRFSIWQIAILALGILPLGWSFLPELPLSTLANAPTSTETVENNDFDYFAVQPIQRLPTQFESGETKTSNHVSPVAIRSHPKRMLTANLILLIWLGVAGLLFLRVLIKHIRTAHAIRLIAIANPEHKNAPMKLQPNVSLYYSDQLEIPVAVGILRKRIILPAEAKDWSSEQFRMVIKHEMAHIERNDVFWQLISSVFNCIFWFQPLLWWAARESALSREQACDDRVIADGEDQTTYAMILVRLAACMSGRSYFLAGALSMSQKPIERRLRTILSSDILRSTTNRWIACFAGAVMLLIATSVCSLHPFQPISGVAQVVRKPASSFKSSNQDVAAFRHLRQKKTRSYKLNANDVLGIYVEGVLGEVGSLPPVFLPPVGDGAQGTPPTIGFPVPVKGNGTIDLPLIEPVDVKNLTMEQVEKLLVRAYQGGGDPVIAAEARIVVTLMRERTCRVFVVRNDGKKQKRFVAYLPAYKNDVFHALTKTGGLPDINTSPKISVLRTGNAQANLIRDFKIAEFYKKHSPKDFPDEIIPSLEKAVGVVQIPTRAKQNKETIHKTNIILKDGDIVYVN